MIDDVTIIQKINDNVHIKVPHLKNEIYGSVFYKDKLYKTKSLYRPYEIIQYLVNNSFITILNHEICDNNYNKYTFQLTLKSILRML